MNNFSGTLGLIELLNSLPLTCSNSCYKSPGASADVGNISIMINSAATQSVLAFNPPEPDLVPYECTRSSGVLAFWGDDGEDIYSFENGKIVQEAGTSIEEFAAPVSQECKKFCDLRGLNSVLAKCLVKVKEIFSNIEKLSAELDYFRDNQEEDSTHIVIRVEVSSNQKTALRNYDRWTCWMAKNVTPNDSEFFTLTVRRV